MNIEGMLGSMDLSQVERKVDKMNSRRRLPAVILVDTSGSMSDYEDLLKRSVEGLYDAILKDRTASSATELAVLSFNSDIEILQKLCEIKKQEAQGRNLDFRCSGVTLTGLALKTAIMQLEARKKVYMESVPKIKYYSPIIFLVSDGKPECYNATVQVQEDEAMRFSKEYIRKEVAANKLVVVAVEVGDKCDHNLMRELTGLTTDKHVTKVNSTTEFVNFFKVSSSIIIKYSGGGTDSLNDISFSEM